MAKRNRKVDPAAIQLAAAIIIARQRWPELMQGSDEDAAKYAVHVHDQCLEALKRPVAEHPEVISA